MAPGGSMAGERRLGWYYGWNIVAGCVVAGIAASALPINAFSLFLAGWSADLHVPLSTLQIGIGGCGLGCALVSPLIGLIADKYSGRWLISIGLALMALFCLGISSVTAVWQYIALYALLLPVGLTLSTSLLANSMVSRWFVRRLGLALSITAVGLGMAGVVMPPIVAAAMPDLGWRGIWRTGGIIIAVLVLPLVIAVLREKPREKDGSYYLTGADGGAAVPPHSHGGKSDLRWRDIFKRRNFWLLIVVYVPMLALYGGAGQNIAPIATSRGLSAETAGVLLSLLSVSQLAATMLAGVMSDRLGNRLPLAVFAFATAVGGVFVAFGAGSVTLGIGIILAGFGGSFWPLIAASAAAEFGAGAVGRVFGLVMFFLPLVISAPFAVAKARESTGSYTLALLVMAFIAVVGGLACLLLMREQRAPKLAAGDSQIEAKPADTLA
jgi:MFS family permease